VVEAEPVVLVVLRLLQIMAVPLALVFQVRLLELLLRVLLEGPVGQQEPQVLRERRALQIRGTAQLVVVEKMMLVEQAVPVL
jgi:hypothetical protein